MYKIVIWKPEWKRPPGKRGYRWEDNVKVDLKEIEREVVDWIELAQNGVQ
jgi:hypothetical protein